MLHVPVPGQSVSFVQAIAGFLLQWPPMMAQSLTVWQRFPEVLQCPSGGQLAPDMQLAPLMLHAPGCGVQSEFCVQLLVV